MMHPTYPLSRAFAVCTLLTLPSCIIAAAAAVGAVAYGAVSYHGNEAHMDVQQDVPTTFAAARSALRELGYPIDATQQPGATEGTLTGDDARVIVERHPGDFTRVRARVGMFDSADNGRRAGLILEEIKRQL